MVHIGLDIDGVLADYENAFISRSNEMYASNLEVHDYSNDWRSVWRVDNETCLDRSTYFLSDEFYSTLGTIPGACDGVKSLMRLANVSIVSSRSESSYDATKSWLLRVFGELFWDSMSLSSPWDGQQGENARRLTKLEQCADMGIDVLIDDEVRHLVAVSKVGVRGIWCNFGPHVQQHDTCKGIVACRNWPEVVDVMSSWSGSS